jgi:hypothetical protein
VRTSAAGRSSGGHATVGAVLIDPAGRVPFIEHLALARWLLPGGHLEGDDGSAPAEEQSDHALTEPARPRAAHPAHKPLELPYN